MEYDLDYYENMLREYSGTAEQICKIRWDFITSNIPSVNTVLDYGSGVGWFRAWRPKGVLVDTYDIGPYPQTGVDLKMYDVLCLWDVLEHIADFSQIEPILALSKSVMGTIPIKDTDDPYATWKHFKPGEHLHYWNNFTLTALFQRYGHDVKTIRHNVECPPRENIASFWYEKAHPQPKQAR